jgi:hypothetical protein
MPTYLERYRAGEHEAVWRELVALGPAVREERVLPDARAVARETMTRALHNVERIVERLTGIGYRFAHPAEVRVPPSAALLARLDRLEAQAGGPLPLALRAFYEVVGSVSLMGSHPALSGRVDDDWLERRTDAMVAAVHAHAPPAAAGAPAPLDGMAPELAALLAGAPAPVQAQVGDAMRAARELMRRMFEVQADTERLATGVAPSARLLDDERLAASLAPLLGPRDAGAEGGGPLASDPLVVWAPERDEIAMYHELGDPDDARALDDDGWTGRYVVEIAPDACHKANTSGGAPYQIAFPEPAADAPVLEHGAASLVEYLRECFRWGGFPGLAGLPVPPAELLLLTAGLQPL